MWIRDAIYDLREFFAGLRLACGGGRGSMGIYCDACGHCQGMIGSPISDYCPKCGASMSRNGKQKSAVSSSPA